MLYLDTSALVKYYLKEPHSTAVRALLDSETFVGTGLLCKAEVAATFAKATRMHYMTPAQAQETWTAFAADWETYIRLTPTEDLLDQAAHLALAHGLRGYDAVHLASALVWQRECGQSVILATFDRQLWEVGKAIGMAVWPPECP